MRTTLRWLREFADVPIDDADELADVLGSLGFEVEGAQELRAPFSGVLVARVTGIRPHPDADRIRLATVDHGTGSVEVVCGAWNFDEGAIVPFSPPGATLRGPDGEPFVVERRTIRGFESPGMICSLRELGLGEDHAGILVLPDAPPVGTDFASTLPYPDLMLDVDVGPNRPDVMSTLGLARELAAYYGLPLREPEITLAEDGPPATVSVRIEDPDGCPRFTAREVRNVSVGPSPLWMRIRLEACGVRAISNVVDISNYVMLELGHPNHVFDKDLLGDEIVVRRARDDETIRTLDGVERSLHRDDIVVADAERPVGIGGVMGGGESEVGKTTKNVVIEAAYFHPPSVLLTAKRHGLHTEASSRFQRGMDPNGAERANRRVAQLLAEHAAGIPAPGAVDAYPRVIEPRTVELALSEVTRVMGKTIEAEVAKDLLTRLGFEVEGDDPLMVTSPTRRPDVGRPVDLIEEVARLHGYENFPDRIAVGTGGGLPTSEKRLRELRRVMVGAGYFEAIMLSFLGQEDLDRLGLADDDPRRDGIELTNPLREEEGVLRTTLLPGLLRAAANNAARGVRDVALFETARVFLDDPAAEIPAQPEMLTWVAAGRGYHWHGEGRSIDVFDATGVWSLLRAAMRLDEAALRPTSHPPFHPERSAEVVWDDEVIGAVGEIHPTVAAAFGLRGRVAGGELRLDRVLVTPPAWSFSAPSIYPPVFIDLAFELEVGVPAADLLEVTTDAAGPLLEQAEVFDVFEGEPLEQGRKSIALRLTLRAPDRTLTDDEATLVRESIEAAVTDRLGGMLRTA